MHKLVGKLDGLSCRQSTTAIQGDVLSERFPAKNNCSYGCSIGVLDVAAMARQDCRPGQDGKFEPFHSYTAAAHITRQVSSSECDIHGRPWWTVLLC